MKTRVIAVLFVVFAVAASVALAGQNPAPDMWGGCPEWCNYEPILECHHQCHWDIPPASMGYPPVWVCVDWCETVWCCACTGLPGCR